jgi:hypothetical protein
MCTIYSSVYNTEVVNELRRLHDNFVLVQASKQVTTLSSFVKITIMNAF